VNATGRVRHLAIATLLLIAGPSCAEGMGGPMDDPSGDDSGVTVEASQPQGNGHDGSSQPNPGQDSSATNGDDSGPTGQDSAPPDLDAAAEVSTSSDTGGPTVQDASSGQDSSPAAQDAMGPPDSGPPSNCAGPSTPAACHACSPGPSCQPNGCYNGYICNTQTNHCGAPGTCT
jgi:hypothetical protein